MRLIFCLTMICIPVFLTPGFAEDRRPNLVVIVVDDLGYMDIEPNNPQTFYETPHLVKLASQGLRFTQGYAACPVCSPTRYSLLTGRHPVRAATTNYFGGYRVERFQPAEFNEALPHQEITIAERLKDAGYDTCFVGKWHLGPTEEYWPQRHGFDINIGGHKAGHPKSYFSPYANPHLVDGPAGEFLTERLATEAADFIGKQRSNPFFLYYCLYQVHTPLKAPQHLIQKYQAKAEKLGLSSDQLSNEQLFGREQQYFASSSDERKVRLVQQHATYAAMVESMDTAVGRIMSALDTAGLAENTLLVFTSDNGGLSTAEGSPTSNAPLRAGKGWGYEGGIRVPWIVRWPGKIEPDTTSQTPVVSSDLYPTLLDVAGLPAMPEQHLDGVSLLPLLRQTGDLAERPIFWHYPHYANQGGFPCSVIRKGDMKLLVNLEDGTRELYDLSHDPSETTNLASAQPDVSTRLFTELRAWMADSDARLLEAKAGQNQQPWRPE